MLRSTCARRWAAAVALAVTLSLAVVPAAAAAPAWRRASETELSWLGRVWTALEQWWSAAVGLDSGVAAKEGPELDPFG
jgi:ABC-type nitrate/sulfonate/bicarbonate transport system substrate-binding protein